MPDFDVDFCQERRGDVIEYVSRKYGEHQRRTDRHVRADEGEERSSRTSLARFEVPFADVNAHHEAAARRLQGRQKGSREAHHHRKGAGAGAEAAACWSRTNEHGLRREVIRDRGEAWRGSIDRRACTRQASSSLTSDLWDDHPRSSTARRRSSWLAVLDDRRRAGGPGEVRLPGAQDAGRHRPRRAAT